MTTPGMLRQFAAQARHDASDYRRWAHETTDPHKKRRYERWADAREEYADWYEDRACQGEITTDYHVNTFAEAAE